MKTEQRTIFVEMTAPVNQGKGYFQQIDDKMPLVGVPTGAKGAWPLQDDFSESTPDVLQYSVSVN